MLLQQKRMSSKLSLRKEHTVSVSKEVSLDLTNRAHWPKSEFPIKTPTSDPKPHDIESTEELTRFLVTFYASVNKDRLLGPLFNDVAKTDWEEHVPRIAKFWGRILFGTKDFQGNPLQKHLEIHARSPFSKEHFYRWLDLFFMALDTQWSGPNTAKLKAAACHIARAQYQRIRGQPICLDRFMSIIQGQ